MIKNQDKKLTIVSDIDGCVAEFIYNACVALKELYGTPEVPIFTTHMPTWGFESLGVNSEQEKGFWAYVNSTEHYWLNQQEMYPGIVKEFAECVDSSTVVYWCTNKTQTNGASAETQTALWLQKYGMPLPNVVVSKEKGHFCKSVAATLFLDDKASNVLDVLEKSPETSCYYLSHKYGVEHEKEVESKGGKTIYHTREFLTEVKKRQEIIQQVSVCC
jgi:hypothetical protein